MLDQIPEKVIDDAYGVAESFIRHACEDSENQQQFEEEIAFCQVMASRLLAVLAFNSFIQKPDERTLKGCLDQVISGVRVELGIMGDEYAEGRMKDVEVGGSFGGEEN